MKYKKMGHLLRKVFPNMEKCPINSMISSIGTNSESTIVSMFVFGDDLMLQDFGTDKVDIQISCLVSRNKMNIGKDLTVRIDFFFETGHPRFDAVIPGELQKEQKELINALQKVDELILWIVDKNHDIMQILQVKWDYEIHKKILEKL